MSDEGRLPPSWGPPPGAGPDGLAGLFHDPPAAPAPVPPDPAALAAAHQAELEAGAGAGSYAYTPPEPDPSRSGGAHRARRQPTRYILPAMVGAIAIVLLGVGISGYFGNNPATSSGPVLGSQHSSIVSPPAASSTGSPSVSTPSASVVSSPPPKPPTHRAPPPPVAPPVVHAPAVVLNETPIRGLAAAVAARLRTKNWVVTGTGNWRGNIGSTTVYYPPGMEAAARSLAYDLGVDRIRPSVGGMLTNRLSVVLTSNPY
jgi:LytR cell envelope-related transcriptional attenuator